MKFNHRNSYIREKKVAYLYQRVVHLRGKKKNIISQLFNKRKPIVYNTHFVARRDFFFFSPRGERKNSNEYLF